VSAQATAVAPTFAPKPQSRHHPQRRRRINHEQTEQPNISTPPPPASVNEEALPPLSLARGRMPSQRNSSPSSPTTASRPSVLNFRSSILRELDFRPPRCNTFGDINEVDPPYSPPRSAKVHNEGEGKQRDDSSSNSQEEKDNEAEPPRSRRCVSWTDPETQRTHSPEAELDSPPANEEVNTSIALGFLTNVEEESEDVKRDPHYFHFTHTIGDSPDEDHPVPSAASPSSRRTPDFAFRVSSEDIRASPRVLGYLFSAIASAVMFVSVIQ
jgi:hypothetical protein